MPGRSTRHLLVLTFEPHPRRFFVPDTGPFRLTMLPAKLRLLEQYGVQAVLAQHFDTAFAALSADAFVDEVLLAGMGARHVVCGYDFTFGARRGGNVEMLRDMGAKKGFGVTVLDPVMREGEIYSSTSIREALRAGWPSEAAELLGHAWEIEGVVEQGDKRGRTIGFPTANVALGEHLRPRFGVYAVRALIDGTSGATASPTSAGGRPSASCRRISRSTCSISPATSTASRCASPWSISSGPR